MCGIAGYATTAIDPQTLEQVVAEMTIRLAHRGPDGSGIYRHKAAVLGHRRLSIIDIEGGSQPMLDNRGYAITYNGEIYNYVEVRRDLESLGETFVTSSDTEVLLKAYIRWGSDCLQHLNGMFAVAVLELSSGKLFLARDRIGIKPLYFARIGPGLAFASEIKSLLCLPQLDRTQSLEHVPYFLSFGYFPEGATGYAAIKQLRPGHWLEFCDGREATGCYWDIDEITRCRGIIRANAGTDQELQALIEDAVTMQTVADVSVGTFLSGGLDSGIVNAVLAAKGQFASFTVAIGGDSFDESAMAREVAAAMGTDHHQIGVAADDLLQYWELLLGHFDEPFADTSALPTYVVSKYCREFVKVVLSGDGGDEQWGGYGSYKRQLQIQKLRDWFPSPWLRHLAGKSARAGARGIGWLNPLLGSRIGLYADLLEIQEGLLHGRLDRHMSNTSIGNIAGERLIGQLADAGDPETAYIHPWATGLDASMLVDIRNFMVGDVLRKVDMMSMLTGLEVRVPLLDHRIVEHSAGLSWQDKVTTRETKTIARRLYRDVLPPAIISGQKRGFGVPLDEWFRGPLRDFLFDTLSPGRCLATGMLNPEPVGQIMAEHCRGDRNHGKALMSLLSLQRWAEGGS